MTDSDKPDLHPSPEFMEWAKHRMREMKEKAEIVTEALGLPPEAKFSVMRAIYEGRLATTEGGDPLSD